MRGNVTTIILSAHHIALAGGLYRYDYGQQIRFKGVELPENYEVHFANSETGQSLTMIGNADGVDIPDELLTTGKDIFIWVFLHKGESDGETVYKARLKVTDRAKPTNTEPTPVQQDAITTAIAALNREVETIATDVISANKAKDDAEAAKTAAEAAQRSTEGVAEALLAASATIAETQAIIDEYS
jgi:hypothetical protein